MPSSQLIDDRVAAERHPSATGSLILVVDPDPDTCAMYVAGLALSGRAADGVADGREALARAISSPPAVVVTETRVPGLDGFELCRLLRRDPDTRHIPILVLTSDAGENEIAKAKEAGADRVLLKPCLPDVLTREVQAILPTRTERQRPSRRGEGHVPAAHSTSSAHSRSRLHQRGETTMPPLRPPKLVCPKCDVRLVYERSHIGGVSAKQSEQWDDYKCPEGCGRFQYRQRTRKLRELS